MKFFLILLLLFLVVGCEKSPKLGDIQLLLPDKETNQTSAIKRVYGKSLNQDIKIQNFQEAACYMPQDIKSDTKLPVVLFAPGWNSQNHLGYKTLLTFIASQGYIAIYANSPMEYNSQEFIHRYAAVLKDKTVSDYIDNQNIGVVGHSSGGGLAFKILDYFSKNGYGNQGRFIFSMDPWFAFEMSDDDFENFPKNTKVVIQQYTKHTSTDPRIALTIFNKLSTLGDENRDYQVYEDVGHGYPFGNHNNYDQMQIILKPLDALMDYVFGANESAYKVALDVGSDDPYDDMSQPVNTSSSYEYKCYGEDEYLTSVLQEYGIDYCKIVP